MNKKILIFSLFFLALILFLPKTAQATTNADITYDSNNTATTTNTFGQSFIPTQNNFKGVKITASEDLSGLPAILYLCAGQISQVNFSTTYDCTGTDNNLVYTDTVSPTCTYEGGLYRCTFTYTASQPLTAGITYYFSIKYATSYSFWLVDPGGGYTNGQVASGNNYVSTGDAYFITYYDTAYINWGIFWSINSIIVPSNNWIYSKMPSNIIFKYNNLGGLYSEAWFQIYRLTGKGGTPYMSVASPHVAIASTTALMIEGAPLNLSEGFYRLYNAHFANQSINYILTPIDFQVAGTSTNPFINASTTLSKLLNSYEENVCDGIDTGSLVGQMLCAFKKAGLWLFKPDESSITALIGSYMDLKEAFPFNSFFGITDAFQSGISTTTSENNFKIPFITATGTITTLSVMSSSTLGNLIGQTNNGIFRQSIIYFAWLLAGAIIYFTIRKK